MRELKRKVLIIDDEEDCCLLMSKFFSRNNYEVLIAHTLNEGIDIVKTQEPQYIFLDNNLPDGLGWKVAKKISETYSDLTIILISAYESSLNDDETKSFSVWEKPISMKKLQQFVEASTPINL